MDLGEDYLQTLSGSAVSLRKFINERFGAALRVTRITGLELEWDEFPASASIADVISSAAIAAAEDLQGLDDPSDSHTAAVLTLIELAEFCSLWLALMRASPPERYDPLARALLLGRSLSKGGPVEHIERQYLLRKAQALFEDRASRKKGGRTTARLAAERKQAFLAKAARKLAANPTLSNAQLAVNIHNETRGEWVPAVRTATDWIRRWRNEGKLPANH